MGVCNSFVVEYDVYLLQQYLKRNTVEKDSCLSFDIELLEKMEEAGIMTFKKDFFVGKGLFELRKSLYKEKYDEEWEVINELNAFEVDLNYQKTINMKNLCVDTDTRGVSFFIEKNWKHLTDYFSGNDWDYPICSVKYVVD